MGIQVSFLGARDDDLKFPHEILDVIYRNLTCRDTLVARQVCESWREFLDGKLASSQDKLLMKVEDTEEPVKYFNNSEKPLRIWTQFVFHSVQLSRYSLSFWSQYSDQITYLDFFDCTFPQCLGNVGEEDFRHCCKNLKHLGLRSCNQYLMMGRISFHLHILFDLQNLESLDLSQNTNLSDFVLLTLLTSTQNLRRLNLSECKMAFTKAVFNRFYPAVAQGQVSTENFQDFSDNVLTFHMLHWGFLDTPRAKCLRELIFDDTRVDFKALALIQDLEKFHWTTLCVNNCSEIKATEMAAFLKEQKHLTHFEIESSKLDFNNLSSQGVDLSRFKHLVLSKNGEVGDVSFLQWMPNLQFLNLSSCAGLQLNPDNFVNCGNLRVLKLRSIIPFYDMNRNNTIVAGNLATILSGLHQITELDIGVCGSTVTDVVMQAIIGNMPGLQFLKVCQSRVTDRGVAGIELDDFDSRLSPSTVLKRRATVLERNSSNPPGFCLSRLVSLKKVSFSKCKDLSEATWKVALKLPNLSFLDISFCGQISTSGFSAIVNNCRNLETLNVMQCGLHISGNQEILDEAKSKLTRLRRIIL